MGGEFSQPLRHPVPLVKKMAGIKGDASALNNSPTYLAGNKDVSTVTHFPMAAETLI